MLELAIIYRPVDGRPLSLATIERDTGLLQHAAAVAIREARDKVQELSQADPLLGRVQMEEAEKLQRILSALLPWEVEAIAVV